MGKGMVFNKKWEGGRVEVEWKGGGKLHLYERKGGRGEGSERGGGG